MKIATPLKKVTSKSLGPVKPPLSENCAGGSTPPPPLHKGLRGGGGGVHTMFAAMRQWFYLKCIFFRFYKNLYSVSEELRIGPLIYILFVIFYWLSANCVIKRNTKVISMWIKNWAQWQIVCDLEIKSQKKKVVGAKLKKYPQKYVIATKR